MNIIIIDHAIERAIQRGTTREEILRVLQEGIEVQAKKGRKGKEIVFDYGKEWLGKYYPQKKVVVIYVMENEDIVVITAKVYYGKWEVKSED
ncbi:MAG: hypothetical protein A2Y48_07005 [Nitrospirae bacterium RIFCSPLOW2_12_42_9]|nr:MAG: hypothetical protein A2Z60_03150 [Nitrospirae bacterium RIFCSPLOWO2_02_42_7]OGW60759.1 MAG: hypothetical protein A2Y48_07005 [Nitrospirae bacterium RIFCSPLOW2_12_42_9]HBI24079.1 hypothetical protein [Nitrospiraceae bacterium]